MAVIAVSLLGFTSCSDDDYDDFSSEITNNIVGTWQITHIEGYWYDSTKENIVTVDEDWDDDTYVDGIQFLGSGSCYIYDYLTEKDRLTYEYTYKVVNDRVALYDIYGELFGQYKVISINSTTAVVQGTLDAGDSYTYRLTLTKTE